MLPDPAAAVEVDPVERLVLVTGVPPRGLELELPASSDMVRTEKC